MAAAEFVKAVSRIVSLDSQRRILKDLEINGRLEYEETSAEELERIKKEYFQRKLIKDLQWDLKLKEELRRKEAQRQAFSKAKAEQEEKLRKQKELAQIEEARRKRLAEEESNKRYAFVLDNMSHFTINFYLSWAKGDWKQYSLKPNQKMIYNSKESEVEIFVYDNQLTHYFPNKKFSKRFNLKSKLTKKDLLNNNEEYKKFPLYYLRAEDVSGGITANPINIISVYDSNLEILRK